MNFPSGFSSLIFEDAIGSKVGNKTSDPMHAGNYRVRYEEHVTWEDPHETYADITTPVNLLLEYNSWAIRELAPVYQYIDHISSEGRLIYEDGSLIANEVSVMKDGETEDESYFYLE